MTWLLKGSDSCACAILTQGGEVSSTCPHLPSCRSIPARPSAARRHVRKDRPYKPLRRRRFRCYHFARPSERLEGDSSEPMPSVRMEKPDPDRRLHLDSIYRTTAQMDYGAPQRLRSGDAYAAAMVQHRRPEIPRGRRKGTLQSFQERQRLWDQAGNSYGTAMVHFKKSLP